MRIQAARAGDLPRIKQLYDEAIAFQRSHGHPFWKDVDLAVVEADIAAGCQYTLSVDAAIAGIFSLCPPSAMDTDLWHGRQPASARHLNRIIVGLPWRGQTLFGQMLAWCQSEVARHDLQLLRLDTWAENAALISYYARFGFQFVGERVTSASLELPPQYRGIRLALMELPVRQ